MESMQFQESHRLRPGFEPRPQRFLVPEWKKPPIDANLLARLREILELGDLDELPENLYLTIGLQMGLNRWWGHCELTYKEMVDLVLQAWNRSVPQEGATIKSGWVVRIKSMNCNGIYICRGPFGRELVNIYGIWKLLDPEDLDVPDEAIRDSELNRHAALGKKLELAETVAGELAGLDRVRQPPVELKLTAADFEELR